MFRWFKDRSKKKILSSMLKAMIKPILFALMAVLDATLEGWKMAMIIKLKNVKPAKYADALCDEVDELRRIIKTQIKSSMDA